MCVSPSHLSFRLGRAVPRTDDAAMHCHAANGDLVVQPAAMDCSFIFRIADAAEISPDLVKQLIREAEGTSPLESDRCVPIDTAEPCRWNMCSAASPYRANASTSHRYCKLLCDEVKDAIEAAHLRSHLPGSAAMTQSLLSRRAIEERICRAIVQTAALRHLCPDTQATIAARLRLAAPVDLRALAATCHAWHASLAPWLRRQRHELLSQRVRMRRARWKEQMRGGAPSFDAYVEETVTMWVG